MIEIRKLHKSFHGTPVLNDVNLTVASGSVTAVVGESGCGKTVLLKCIMGLMRVEAGTILVDGEEVTAMDSRTLYQLRKRFGMLFQSSALFDFMTVSENVSLPLITHTQYPDDAIRKRVREMLDAVGLKDGHEKMPAELSGGMKKRVGLARALILEPVYMLYDEPTAGLDPVRSHAINQLIVETQKRRRITSIVVTHDIQSAFMVSNRIAMLHEGIIIFEGTPKEMMQCPEHKVRQFVRLAMMQRMPALENA